MRNFITLLFTLLALHVTAQSTDKKLSFSGYAETFYSYDFSKPSDGERPSFLYNYDRHNEFNVNLAFLKAAYTDTNVRANVALMAGTYTQSNLNGEPVMLRNIFEANVGFKVSKKNNIWLDMGVMPSHIGFESAIGKDCWNLSRSLVAENSPYYETGAKLGFTSKNEQWYLAAMLLNGWQRINRINESKVPDFGTQIQYKPGKKVTINWSNYIGDEDASRSFLRRFYNNFYVQAQFNKKWGIIAGADLGMQERNTIDNTINSWWSRVVVLRYAPTEKKRFAFRIEDFDDANNIILNLSSSSFHVTGLSVNYDYLPAPNAMFRIEYRNFLSKDKIFFNDGKFAGYNNAVTTSFSLSF